MEPTGQVKSQAIADGFDNVHDWLVFRETGDAAATLVLRKWEAPWAAWLTGGSDGEKEENGALMNLDKRCINTDVCMSVNKSLTICAVNASNLVDTKKAQPPARSRNNSTAGAAPASDKVHVREDKQGGDCREIGGDEPPCKVAKLQTETVAKKPDSSQGAPRSLSGILVRS